MTHPYLSIVAIARNEEKVVARFINSIREHLGSEVEIVIVDTGSKDATVSIARSMGAKVYEEGERFAHLITKQEEEYINSQFNDRIITENQRLFFYSDARNCADSHATGEWCISIDLHWVLVTGGKLEQKLRNLPRHITNCSYNIILKTNTFSSTRIYRRKSGRWNYRIHEVFVPFYGDNITLSELEAKKVSTETHGYLPHLAYHFYFGDYAKDSTEYARFLYYFSREVYYQGEKYKKLAIKLLTECAQNTVNWNKERSQAAIFISILENDLNIKRKNLIWSVTLNPIWREPYLRLADVAYKECDWAGCIGYAQQALKIERQEGALHIENKDNYTTEPYRLIYVSLIQMARACRNVFYINRAIDYVEEALKIEKKTGCSSNVFVGLWKEGYKCYKAKNNKSKMNKMFELCHNFDNKIYEKEEDLLK